MLASLVLTPDEVTTLDACSHHAKYRRHRRRAQAVLGHHRGQSLNQLAVFFAVRYATVHGWLKAWREQGLASLCEGGRAGRPPKLPPAAKKVSAWLGPAIHQLRGRVPHLRRAFGIKLKWSS